MIQPPFKEIAKFLSQSSIEEFKAALPFFSLIELTCSFHLLQIQPSSDPQNKLENLFKFIDTSIKWEVFGEKLSSICFISFLNFLIHQPNYHTSLNLLLIGLPYPEFSKSLHFLQKEHIYLLKQGGLLEPLQYQLTQFIHEGEKLKENIQQKTDQFQQMIFSMNSEKLDQSDFQHLICDIDALRNQLLDYLERASVALALVWHTDRLDLIEKLSSINETVQHQLTHLIGHSYFDDLAATGLYLFLEQKFATIFDVLKDEDASIEGITRLSVWHLKDYEELGLLPYIPGSSELNFQQMSFVQHQLNILGISQVKDLKKFHLFSKSLLKNYIDQHLLSKNN